MMNLKILKKASRLIVLICLIALILLTLTGCGSRNKPAAPASAPDFTMGDKELLYEGDKKGDVVHGKGSLYLGKEKVYGGEFVEGLIEGQGKLYDNGKVKYEGQFKNNKALGKGILYNDQEEPVYQGEITVKGSKVGFAGRGKILYPTGEVFYDGELKDGMPEGKGTYFDLTGNILQDNK